MICLCRGWNAVQGKAEPLRKEEQESYAEAWHEARAWCLESYYQKKQKCEVLLTFRIIRAFVLCSTNISLLM